MKKTIYLTRESAWQEQAAGRLERASGGDGPAVRCWRMGDSAAPVDKVVDLAAWRAENLAEPAEDAFEAPESGLASYQGRELVRRPREKHRAALALGELAATLSVLGLTLVMILRVLVF